MLYSFVYKRGISPYQVQNKKQFKKYCPIGQPESQKPKPFLNLYLILRLDYYLIVNLGFLFTAQWINRNISKLAFCGLNMD